MVALIVDDDEVSLELLQDVLAQLGYEVERAANGKEALEVLRHGAVHLVITDWEMPEMNGLELCREIRRGDFDGYVYVIMLTGRDSGRQKIEGLHAGADSFLTKPLNSEELLVSLKTAERILSLETRDLAIFALAKLSESRDPETGGHIERVQSYARLLAQHLSTTAEHHDLIDTEFVRLIFQTSPLHDIGKVGIPDNVLLKPARLDDQEMAIMKTHATLGAHTLEASLARFPNVRFLQMARDIAAAHHERWDGKGYPRGLSGNQIPLAARIVALADVYDALTSRRVYREAMSHAQARVLILGERGAHFDPRVVDAFLQMEEQFIEIHEQFNETEQAGGAGEAAAGSRTRSDSSRAPDPVESADEIKVMVIDNSPDVRSMLTNFLFSIGLSCVSFETGEAALAVLDAYKPRIMVCDWEMPGIDGLEVCRRVRARAPSTRTHFILSTVHTAREQLGRAFDAGIDDFIGKPFSESEILARVRAGMRAVALHDELTRRNQGSQRLNEQLTALNRRLEKLAITDDLTGLYNRRQAMHRLEEHWALSDRYGRPIAVAVVDIDHFRRINDEHGHGAGDAMLRSIASILRASVRTTDVLCRIGGEEFLVILPLQTIQEAEICIERCRQAVAAQEFGERGKSIRATVSIGIASRSEGMQQCAQLLSEADDALHAAKQAGRNVIYCARAEPTVA